MLCLTNLYLKRLARKGSIKITTIPRNRIRYLLTPQGLTEKSRLTYQYMQHSLSYYRDIRTRLKEMLSLRGMNIDCVGFIVDNSRESFLGYPVCTSETVSDWQFDRVLIADLEHAAACEEQLVESGVPREKVLRLGLSE